MNNKQKILFVVFLILTAAAGYMLVRSLIPAEKPNVVVKTNSETVIKQIRDLNRLETASFTIEKVIDAGTAGGKFEQFLFGDRILLIAHGNVVAGVNMAKVRQQDITVNDKSIVLKLPAAEIFSTTLDSDQTRVYDRQTGLLSKGDKDLESEARKAAEQTIRDAACKGNILQTASDNARKQLTTFLKALQFENITITIPAGSC